MKKKYLLLSLRSLTLAACALFGFPALAQVAGPLTPTGPPEQASSPARPFDGGGACARQCHGDILTVGW